MSIIRLQEMTPQIYTEESRDFQLLTRLYDSVFNGMKFDTDSITSLINTKECRTNILQLLQTKLGFFTERKIDDEKLRSILECFPILVRNKGSLKAIKEALYLFLRMYSVSSDMEVYYLKTPFSEPFSEEVPCILANGKYPENNSLIIRIHSFQTKPDISVLEELFRYILPAGINYYIEFDKKDKLPDIVLGSEDLAELLIVSDNLNSEVRNSGQIFTTDDPDSETSKIAYRVGAVNTASLISTDSYVSNRFIGYYTNEEDANDYLETLTDKLYSTAIINYDPVETKTGSIVSFLPDPSVTALENLTVAVNPVQDLHGYDNPWPAGGGKNKSNPDEAQNNKWINTTTGAIEDHNGYWVTGFIAVKSGDVVRCYSKGSARCAWYSLDKTTATYFAWSGDSSGAGVATAPEDGFVVLTVSNSTINYGGNFIVTINNDDMTFAPYSNICPISGWDGVTITRTGKNIIKLSAESEYASMSQYATASYTENNDATFEATHTYSRKAYLFHIKVGETYRLSLEAIRSGGYGRILLDNTADGNPNVAAYGQFSTTQTEATYAKTFTATTDVLRIIFYVSSDGATGSLTVSNLQLEVGSVTTDFMPYNGAVIPISFGEAGTVYDGTLDATTGVLTVDKVGITLDGTQSIDTANYRPLTNTVGWNYPYSLTQNAFVRYQTSVPDIICDSLPTVSYSDMYNVDSPGVSCLYSSSGGTPSKGIYVRVADKTLTTKTAINAWLAEHPIQVVYSLATPQTYYLTSQQVSTLVGENNIWADTGDVTVTYARDFTCVPMICTSYTNNTPTWRRINFLGNITSEDVSTEGGIVAALEAKGITVNNGDLILYNNIYLLRVNGSWQECNYARYIMNTYIITE